jgi:hypothetical protein
MIELYNRRQQVAIIILLCILSLSIIGLIAVVFALADRYYPGVDTLHTLPQIALALVGAMGLVVLSSVISIVVWLVCLKPWYRRQDLEPLFEVPPSGTVPRWLRIGAEACTWLFNKMYPLQRLP